MIVRFCCAVLAFGLTTAAAAEPPAPDSPAQTSSNSASAPPGAAVYQGYWARKPDGDDFVDAYPRVAVDRGISGGATIKCAVTAKGDLTGCQVLDEYPQGLGFGAAALRLSRRFKMADKAGRSVEGAMVTIPLHWQLAP